MERKRLSLLGTAREQEAEQLSKEQELARYMADEPLRIAAEHQRIQSVIDVVGRAFFLLRYDQIPDIIGHAQHTGAHDEFNTPVFAIEYANLRFSPGQYAIHGIKSPQIRWGGRSPFSGRQFKKNFTKDERQAIHKYAPSFFGCEFQAVCPCSGCEEWGAVGELRNSEVQKYKDTIIFYPPAVGSFESLAANIELLNEAASGLALNCGNLEVFGFDPSMMSTAIMCRNLSKKFKDYNSEHRPIGSADYPPTAGSILSMRALKAIRKRYPKN